MEGYRTASLCQLISLSPLAASLLADGSESAVNSRLRNPYLTSLGVQQVSAKGKVVYCGTSLVG